MPSKSTVTRHEDTATTACRRIALGLGAGLLLLASSPPVFARPVSDYCHFFKKDEIEKTLNAHVTEVAPGPLKVMLGAEGLHDQACVFFVGSRVFRITITQTRSADEARRIYKQSVSGQSMVNSTEPKPLAGVRDEAVMIGGTVVLRRRNLVVDFSVRDFVADPETGLSLARTLATMVAARISAGSS
jgi:hypothetical protein